MVFFYFSRLSLVNWLLCWHLFWRGYEKRGVNAVMFPMQLLFLYCSFGILVKELRVFRSFHINYFHPCSSEKQMDSKSKLNDLQSPFSIFRLNLEFCLHMILIMSANVVF